MDRLQKIKEIIQHLIETAKDILDRILDIIK